MKNSGNVIPVQLRELCRAICAIVHANINEDAFFHQSELKTRIPVFRKSAFSDNGVRCELEQGNVNIKVFVNAMLGEHSIYHNAMDLQRRIAEEIILYTSFLPKKIDVIITGVKAKKTQ
ncbi:hypothetical protein J7E38_05470 [Bacillus sp. ISL-35]|uniref:hypothetical protein n=1 Tax=Bacillus sp. ISL-35 TaxID=2819122 RepID=UPI001BEA1CB6|nr:hypothetical protein [Bacillus sp. ISL-35]MBT2678441.1 hypothetical protein [Bacillus sp. ISL-35]MBT2701690.1 hypothetical protein [Chryseobacterium sp. ISL-80]